MSCDQRYLKMLVSNATAGILIGKGGMALKDSVFCLAVFLFKVDLNNTSTTPSLYMHQPGKWAPGWSIEVR